MMTDTEIHSRWEPVKHMMAGTSPVGLGEAQTRLAECAPEQWLARLSVYKFAARMIDTHARVLDVNCGEGLGTWILQKECGGAWGIDVDAAAIAIARRNWAHAGTIFHHGDLSSLEGEVFDALVMLSGTESTRGNDRFCEQLEAAMAHLKPYGVAVLGVPGAPEVPGVACDPWNENGNASENDGLQACFYKLFSQFFVFSRMGELIRAGRHRGADGLIILACGKGESTCGSNRLDQAPSPRG